MSSPDRFTLDEIVGTNLRRLRDERNLSIRKLAGRLRIGEHVVRDMERPRKGQSRREFSWSDLVALCGALDTNLFELVLPKEGVEIADYREFILTDSDSPDVASYHPNARIGRDGLSWRVFGVPGESLTPDLLEEHTKKLTSEIGDRIARLQKLLGIGARTFKPDPDRPIDDLPLTSEVDLFDAEGKHVKTLVFPKSEIAVNKATDEEE